MLENNIKLGVFEDNEKLRNNYVDYFSMFTNYTLTFAFSAIEELRKKEGEILNFSIPDFIFLDINLPGISGIKGISILKSLYPNVVIIMLTGYDDAENIIKAIENGASGYLVKGISLHQIKLYLDNYKTTGNATTPNITIKLFEHINKKYNNKTFIFKSLTKREKEIVNGIVDGLTHKDIGIKLKIKASTVNQHLKSIYIKINVNSKLELISKILNN